MGASLIQPSRVKDEGPLDCKLLFFGNKNWGSPQLEGTEGISTG
jgi:hypothetical protein